MQYLCIILRQLPVLLLCVVAATSVFANAEQGQIYRTVGADGSVSYSDQPGPGARAVPGLVIAPLSPAERNDAQARAESRIDAQLHLAAELAAERRARSADRESAALVRSELREAKAREEALDAEHDRFDAYRSDRYPYYLPPVRRHHRYDRDGFGPYRHDDEPPPEPSTPRQSRPLPPG